MSAPVFSTRAARSQCRMLRGSAPRHLVHTNATVETANVSRRDALIGAGAVTWLLAGADRASAASAAKPPSAIVTALCDAECAASLPERVKLPSGLEYVDIKVGTGASPVPGYQVTVNYVAMNAEGRAFDNSIEKGTPYDIRFAAESVIPGLDEGLKGMKTGGIRRLYIPGNLSFPKGLPSGPGRPRIPPASPVIFDVQVLLVPGFDDLDE